MTVFELYRICYAILFCSPMMCNGYEMGGEVLRGSNWLVGHLKLSDWFERISQNFLGQLTSVSEPLGWNLLICFGYIRHNLHYPFWGPESRVGSYCVCLYNRGSTLGLNCRWYLETFRLLLSIHSKPGLQAVSRRPTPRPQGRSHWPCYISRPDD